MTEQKVLEIFKREIEKDKQQAQYGVSRVPYHTHNNLDSPPIDTSGLNDVLFDHYVSAGNVTTGETTLYTDTIPALTFSTPGDKLYTYYAGVFVSSGTATREIKISFAGTQIFDSGALTLSLSSAWVIEVLLIEVSATVVRYSVNMTTEGAALAAYTNVGELTSLNLGIGNILKITGQAAGVGAATNDIVAKLGYVERMPHA